MPAQIICSNVIDISNFLNKKKEFLPNFKKISIKEKNSYAMLENLYILANASCEIYYNLYVKFYHNYALNSQRNIQKDVILHFINLKKFDEDLFNLSQIFFLNKSLINCLIRLYNKHDILKKKLEEIQFFIKKYQIFFDKKIQSDTKFFTKIDSTYFNALEKRILLYNNNNFWHTYVNMIQELIFCYLPKAKVIGIPDYTLYMKQKNIIDEIKNLTNINIVPKFL